MQKQLSIRDIKKKQIKDYFALHHKKHQISTFTPRRKSPQKLTFVFDQNRLSVDQPERPLFQLPNIQKFDLNSRSQTVDSLKVNSPQKKQRHINQRQYVIVDIQTTGLSRSRDKIIEVAAILIQGQNIKDTFHTLVNPETKINSFITKLTGINNQMVKQAPKIDEVINKLLEFISDHIFVAHNAHFDYGFISENAYRIGGRYLENPRLCTRKLACRLLPNLQSKKLQNLCDHFQIQNKGVHRAIGDAQVAAKIFLKFKQSLKTVNIIQNQEIMNFERQSIRKIRQKWPNLV